MTEFRKHKSGRQYARIEGDKVVRVSNYLSMAVMEILDNAFVAEEIMIDKDLWFPCTEQEFKEAYQEALRRIQNTEIN
jgi:hypothetical protein